MKILIEYGNMLEKMFDAIYCIHYIPYKDRWEYIQNELKRVGILNNNKFHWKFTYDSPFQEDIINYHDHANKSKPYIALVAYHHYCCIKEAYELGYNNILIMENDIEFLKDITKLNRYINNIPNYDICCFDWLFNNINLIKLHKIPNNDRFLEFSGSSQLFTAACYALSRRGMKYIIDNEEQKMWGPDHWFWAGNGNLIRIIPNIQLAIQNPKFKGKNTDINNIRYKMFNVNFNDYGS